MSLPGDPTSLVSPSSFPGGLEGAFEFSYNNVLGPYLIGLAFECFGMGIVLLQSLTYLAHHPSTHTRKSYITGGVLVLLVLNVLQTTLDILRVHAILVRHFGDILWYLKPRRGDEISQILGSLIAMLCQAFLLHRTLIFLSSLSLLSNLHTHTSSATAFRRVAFSRGGRAAYTAVMGCAIVLAAVTGVMTGYGLSHSGSLVDLGRNEKSRLFTLANRVWLITSSCIDLSLSVVFSVELRSSKSAFAQTNSILRRLALLVLGTGFLTTAIQLTAMFMQIFAPGSAKAGSWCYLPILPLAKVYSIGLLVSLNSGGSSSSSSPLSDLAPLGSAILTSRRGSDPSSTLDQPWWPVRERKAGYSSSETTLGYDPWSDASSFAPIIRNYEQKEYTLPRPRPESYILPPPATKSRTPRVLQVEVFRRPVGSARSSFEAM